MAHLSHYTGPTDPIGPSSMYQLCCWLYAVAQTLEVAEERLPGLRTENEKGQQVGGAGMFHFPYGKIKCP